MKNEIYLVKCGDNSAAIEVNDNQEFGDYISLGYNGYSTTSVVINPQLAEMAIKALQEYLKHKSNNIDATVDEFNKLYIDDVNNSTVSSETLLAARKVISNLGERGLIQDNYQTTMGAMFDE